jgi:integrase
MRLGELYGLEWKHIDFENKLIYVQQNWTNRNGYGPTKGRYWRSVPNESAQVLGFLKEQKIKRGNDKFVLHHFNLWSKGEAAKILREFCVGHIVTPPRWRHAPKENPVSRTVVGHESSNLEF